MAPTESRRQPILAAMVRVVGEKGYEAVEVEEVIAAAHTSRTTFYRYFTDKQDCFLAAYGWAVTELVDELIAGCEEEPTWTVRVRNGLTTIVERFASDPAFARAAVVEVSAAGTDARKLHRDAIERLAGLLARGRESERDRELPQSVALMAAGAASGLIFDDVAAGRAAQLTARLPDLLFAVLVPYLGPQAAAAEMRQVGDAH